MTGRDITGRRIVLTVSAGMLLLSGLTGCDGRSDSSDVSPFAASTTLSSTPTGRPLVPETSASPSRMPTPGWTGALRNDQASLRVLSQSTAGVDPADTAVGGIDIRRVSATTRPEWRLELRARPPLAATLDPARRIMEHGIVVDSDGDRHADCRIGISTDAPTRGDLRVWVTDLRTGVTAEQVGAPYGTPIDFFHPGESEEESGLDETANRTLALFFLDGGKSHCVLSASASYYAYAVVMDRGQEPQWDFAPDAAWLKIR